MRYGLILSLAALLVACGNQKTDYAQSGPSRSTTIAEDTGSAETNTALMNPTVPVEKDDPGARVSLANPTQEVHLLEYQVHMGDTLPAGRLALNVENAGKEPHALIIEGNGIRKETPVLPRGNSASIEVDLPPGTYQVWCPVDGHADKGMRKAVRVEAAPAHQ